VWPWRHCQAGWLGWDTEEAVSPAAAQPVASAAARCRRRRSGSSAAARSVCSGESASSGVRRGWSPLSAPYRPGSRPSGRRGRCDQDALTTGNWDSDCDERYRERPVRRLRRNGRTRRNEETTSLVTFQNGAPGLGRHFASSRGRRAVPLAGGPAAVTIVSRQQAIRQAIIRQRSPHADPRHQCLAK
jgi:hypothetical protein